MKTILVINTGSTSTKVAIFKDDTRVIQDNLFMSEEVLKRSMTAVDQLPFRTQIVTEWLANNGYSIKDLDIIAARGGPLPPIKGGAYRVNQLMVDVLTYAPVSRHESAWACMIGMNLAKGSDVPVIIYDGVSVDEIREVARYTGFPGIRNSGRGHILNSRRVSRMTAAKLGKTYEESTFIVAHLGGSISVSAHDRGRIVDIVNAFSGPMSTQRAGRLPMDQLIGLCYSGKYGQQELMKLLNGGSGYKAYFGTQDARKVAELMDAGDPLAYAVTEALSYQTSKAIGEMRVAAEHPVDRVILTGGMANFKFVTEYITKRVSFIAPVELLPGEFEMEALAEGALDVLTGKAMLQEFDLLPAGYATREEFYDYVRSCQDKSPAFGGNA